ncbi:TlpA family protein disulfide reductase [Sinomicrobium sp. M5D2P9]
MRQSNLKVVFLIWIFNFSFAQQMDAGYEPMEIGDTVPDITLSNLINYPTETAKLSDFKGKLLILDFWSTGCISCIESWPKLVSLQEMFKDKIQIVLVNSFQGDSIVKPLVEKRERVLGINMSLFPIACGDSVPKQLFPHNGVPHIVWIDQNREVRSITVGSELKKENIQAFFDGNAIMITQNGSSGMKTKRGYNLREPFFVNGNGQEDLAKKLITQSVLTEADYDFFGFFSFFPRVKVEKRKNNSRFIYDIENLRGLVAERASVKGLFAFAYEQRAKNMISGHSRTLLENRPGNRVVFKVKDTTKYNNYYSYQLTINQPTSLGELQKMMRLDLEKYFGLKARWEKRKRQCLVFSVKDTTRISYNGLGKSLFEINDVDFKVSGPSGRSFMSEIIDWMEVSVTAYYVSAYDYNNKKWPIIDETGIKGPVSIEVEADVFNHKELDKALSKKYGMRLTLEERDVDVLILYESEVSKKKEAVFSF